MRSLTVENFRRSELERRIEEMIALLDLLDGDPELEEEGNLEGGGDFEPSLGWPEQFGLSAVAGIREHDDREREDENDEDGGDAEPEETDQDGDEQDCCRSEDEWHPLSPPMKFDGNGVHIAEGMIDHHHGASERADAFSKSPPLPLIYDFRGT